MKLMKTKWPIIPVIPSIRPIIQTYLEGAEGFILSYLSYYPAIKIQQSENPALTFLIKIVTSFTL